MSVSSSSSSSSTSCDNNNKQRTCTDMEVGREGQQ